MLNQRGVQFTMGGEPRSYPFFFTALRILDQALADGISDNGLELRAGADGVCNTGIEHVPIAVVAKNQAVPGVIKRETLRYTFDCINKPLACFCDLAQVLLFHLKRGIAEKPKCFRQATNLVATNARKWRSQVAARNREHALAELCQSGQ